MSKGIYLVANAISQQQCENLIYSIRRTGCRLPIRVIHFGGKKITSPFILKEAEYISTDWFPKTSIGFIQELQAILSDCPAGFLYRFLPWFGDWDQFIYSDNDIVALINWERLFDYSNGYDIVHADEEYTTEGKYNYEQPLEVKKLFGDDALLSAITAGHFLAKRDKKMIEDIRQAIQWFHQFPHIFKKHDQALLHIASLIGNWKVLNLCRPPYNWLSSWAGDYKNVLAIIQAIQSNELRIISHLHYSGFSPKGNLPIQELLYSNLTVNERLWKLLIVSLKFKLGIFFIADKKKRLIRRFAKLLSGKK